MNDDAVTKAKIPKAKRGRPPRISQLTAREYYIGQIVNAILSSSGPDVDKDSVKRTAIEWADHLVKD